MSRRGSGSYGAVPYHGDTAEEVQVHLARGCWKTRLRTSLWGHFDSQILSDEDPTQSSSVTQITVETSTGTRSTEEKH